MMGPLKTAPSGFTHRLVVVDKFTKWEEAKPIRKLDGKTALKFVNDIVGMTQDCRMAEVISSPPSAPSAAAETDAEAWLGDPGRSYAS
jgi:hypothetical protein